MQPRKPDTVTSPQAQLSKLPGDPAAELLADLYTYLLGRRRARLAPGVSVPAPPTADAGRAETQPQEGERHEQ